MLYLKVINIFLKKKKIFASYSKLSKELKNGTGILVGQAVCKLWIKTVKMLFGSITQEPLGLLTFDDIFEFLGQFTIRYIYYFPKHANANFGGRRCSTPLKHGFMAGWLHG